jgi:hypothetical protein
VIAVAPASLQAELTRFASNLARRHRELLEMRGMRRSQFAPVRWLLAVKHAH